MSSISAIGGAGYTPAWIQMRYALGTAQTRSAASRGAGAAAPVEPVDPVRPIGSELPVKIPVALPESAIPSAADLNNPSEVLARMRIDYPEGEAFDPGRFWRENENPGAAEMPAAAGEEETESAAEVMEDGKCETCENRHYQDGSDDPGVSFKSPTKLSPDEAASAVQRHEQEHVVRERAKAEREGRKVISQSVSIHTDVCPECGRVYVSGGVTRTVTAPEDPEDNSGPEVVKGSYEAA